MEIPIKRMCDMAFLEMVIVVLRVVRCIYMFQLLFQWERLFYREDRTNPFAMDGELQLGLKIAQDTQRERETEKL